MGGVDINAVQVNRVNLSDISPKDSNFKNKVQKQQFPKGFPLDIKPDPKYLENIKKQREIRKNLLKALGEEDKKEKEYNVLVYASGDNNLYDNLETKIVKMGKVAHQKKARFIVEYDKGKNEIFDDLSLTKNWQAKRFVLRPGQTFDEVSEGGKVLNNGKSVNMGDEKHFEDFLVDSMKRYPAKKNILVITGHGNGRMGVAFDHGSKDKLTPEEINKAIKSAEKKTGKKISVLVLDSCLMGQLEVDKKLKESGVEVVIHSEAREKRYATDFANILDKGFANKVKNIAKKENISESQAFAKYFLQKEDELHKKGDYSDIQTHSAVNLKGKGLDEVIEKREKLGKAFASLSKEDKVRLKDIIIKKSQHFRNNPKALSSDYVDIGDLANEIVKDKGIKDKKLKAAAKEFLDSYKKVIIGNRVYNKKFKDATGMFTYIPTNYHKISNFKSLAMFMKMNEGIKSDQWLKGVFSVISVDDSSLK